MESLNGDKVTVEMARGKLMPKEEVDRQKSVVRS